MTTSTDYTKKIKEALQDVQYYYTGTGTCYYVRQ